MIIQKPTYKRNRNGDIIKRQQVELACDQCENRWETFYEHVKRMKYPIQLCPTCRAKERWKTRKPNQAPVKKRCAYCSKTFSAKPYACTSNTCCSKNCANDYANKEKYGHLAKRFEKYKDHVAYLIGLILGDGHLKKCAEQTTRVSIAFDNHKPEMIELAKSIFDKLQIDYYEENKVRNNCKMIGFTLPDKLLSKLGIEYSGDKFKAQPQPIASIVNNINYAIGLINSDGHSYLQANKKVAIGFSNTVLSIVESLKKCLDNNDIHCTSYCYQSKRDKRTNNIPKLSYRVYICKREEVRRIKQMSSFKIKGIVR